LRQDGELLKSFLSLNSFKAISSIKYTDKMAAYSLSAVLSAVGEKKLKLDKKNIDEVLEAFDSNEIYVKRAAIFALIQELDGECREKIISKFRKIFDNSPSLIKESICASAGRMKKVPVDFLKDALEDDDALVQLQAAGALAGGADKSGLDILHAALFNDEKILRFKALDILGEVRSPFSESVLVKLFNDPSWRIRQGAAKVLGSLPGKAITPGLRELMSDSDARVRSAAAVALDNQGALGIHWRVIEDLKSNKAFERQIAAETLGKMKAYQAEPELCRLLSDKDISVCCAAAQALAQIGNKNPVVITALKKSMADSRFAAAYFSASALSDLTGRDIYSLLEQ
jgi:HEAT repeat protein